MSWLHASKKIASKGIQSARARCLADLHRRRRETAGQFYTPEWVAAGIWKILKPSIDAAISRHGGRVAVADTSVGSGRLIAGAANGRFHVVGVDIDARCIDALSTDASQSEIQHELINARFEDCEFAEFGLAVINPPFSLHLESPLMHPYPCTTFGRFGPNTSAKSHEYALFQALDAAFHGVTVAILPSTCRALCEFTPRLVAEYVLPSNTFMNEGANVQCSIFVFTRATAKANFNVERYSVTKDQMWPALPLLPILTTQQQRWSVRVGGFEECKPTITLPVTGNRRVVLHHHNRRIVPRFFCGLTQAKVMNALLRREGIPLLDQRMPQGARYEGAGVLLMDVLLVQENPDDAFNALLDCISHAGGEPEVSPTLKGWWRKLKSKHLRAKTPLRKWIFGNAEQTQTVTAKRAQFLEPGNVKSPAIRRGQKIEIKRTGGDFVATVNGTSATLRSDQLLANYDCPVDLLQNHGGGWHLLHAGLCHEFPAQATQAEQRLRDAGVTWLWPPQVESTKELVIRPYGTVAAWKQGTGKTRLAVALCLVSGRGLIITESGLIPEFIDQITNELKLNSNDWQLIERHTDLAHLKRVNLISYHTLRAQAPHSRKSMGKLLRRRFKVVCADEGGCIANQDSQQTRAVLNLAPGKLFVLDGTPMGNYPRDMLPLNIHTSGAGRSHQPYSLRSGLYIEPQLAKTMNIARRGVEAFRERHVVLEWATNEFLEDLTQGAKREIPKINNVSLFRDWMGPTVQRRLRDEPEFAPYASCPKPNFTTHTIDWDQEHFRHYIDVAVNFARDYLEELRRRQAEGRGMNLVAVLARMQAVMAAANHPHESGKNSKSIYTPLTSKQRYTLDRIEHHVRQGRKTMFYAYSPSVVDRLCHHLELRGIKCVAFHGNKNIEQRTREKDEIFRRGDGQVLGCSWVGQRGLNLPEVGATIFYNRNWTADTEDQAIERTQRPQQKQNVEVEYMHLRGSIDEYQAQMVNFKAAAAHAGLDWGDGATESDVFLHMDAILERFCRETLELSTYEAAQQLCA